MNTILTATDAAAALSPNAVKLFSLYVKDAANWGGSPLVGGNVSLLGAKEDRGLITHLKRAGVITTFVDDGNAWVNFTAKGRDLAVSLGLAF
jgi:hypothetical protein